VDGVKHLWKDTDTALHTASLRVTVTMAKSTVPCVVTAMRLLAIGSALRYSGVTDYLLLSISSVDLISRTYSQ
jgi:hypothetical protein